MFKKKLPDLILLVDLGTMIQKHLDTFSLTT